MKNMPKNNQGYPSRLTVIRLDTATSTNDYIKNDIERFREDFPVMVISPEQTGGRGRENRTWQSKANLGIYVSFGVHIRRPENVSVLSSAVGVAAVRSLRALAPVAAQLKWPNDIMFCNQKLGGILIENMIGEDEVTSVIGIGLNLNHLRRDFSAELSRSATSVRLITGRKVSIEETARILSRNLLDTVDEVNGGQGASIIGMANRYSECYLDKEISFSQNRKTIRGVFRGIHPDGGLILEIEDGIRQILYSGEIKTQS